MTNPELSTMAMDEFHLAWRLTDARWDDLPPEVFTQLKPLARDSAELIASMVREFRQMGPYVPKEGLLKIASTHSLVEETIEHSAKIQHWFASLPIACNESVYVKWSSNEPSTIVTTWSMFRAVWNSLWYPFRFDGSF